MAFDLVSAYAESLSPFYVSGDSNGPQTLVESPQQIALRFSPGVVIDGSAASLGAISMRRSGRGGDAFGAAGSFADVPVEFGSILVDDAPNQNQIVLRFKETLPDDSYQIVVGAGLLSTNRGNVHAVTIDLRLQLGSFVKAVVPQPLARVAGSLSQSRDSIDVYFNADEPLLVSSVMNAAAYRVIEVDTAGNDTSTTLIPNEVTFDAGTGKARLRFAVDLPDGKLYRLEVGGRSVTTLALQTETSDENSAFSDAQNLGTLGRTDDGTSSPTISTVTGAIDTRSTVSTPFGNVGFPSQPGSVDEPGHRDTTVDSGAHGLPFASVDPATGITVIEYNFKSAYGSGFDPQGNPLQNVITETQKQRAREVFELYSLVAGIRFVETSASGICIATGDLRALDPNTSVTGVAGLGGGGNVVLNSTIDWGESEYGGYWFNVAMHEIGHALGLGHSYDVPSIMGAPLPGEAVFPGDYDSIHLRQLYQPSGSDVDMYRFELPEAGTFSAETVIARPGQEIVSELDSVLSLYKQEIVNGKTVRTLVARNDDYYGRDSFIGLSLGSGTYFLAVSSTGNTAFNAEVPDSGNGGRSEGGYEARLRFTPASAVGTTVIDASGTPFDGDRDGAPGGAYAFWFRTAAAADTVFIDKLAASGGNGSLAAPYATIKAGLAAIGSKTLLRIVGNDQNKPYLIGTTLANAPLADGSTFVVPKGVTAMIDAGAILKLRAAIVDVGSSSSLTGASRAGASLQVLGIPGNNVVFTSYHDDTVGGDSDNVGPKPAGGQWGGIVFREDSDAASRKAFVNTISQASISYGGGQVLVNSQLASFAPIEIESTRPTVTFSSVTKSSGAAISATPDSFEDSSGRIGPEIRGNRLVDNSINGLFIKIDTGFGRPLERLSVPARLRSTDVVYVLQENLVIDGGAGGYVDSNGIVLARQSGRLAIDPGVVVKLQGARIELERGVSQLIAEGSPGQRVIFTAFGDNRFGAGGTFDTNGNLPDKFDAYGAAIGTLTVGDWGGIIANAGAKASIDQAYLAFGGGTTPIEGTFDSFNVIEVHQADVRLVNSRLENNASGKAVSSRDGRGTNEAATVFVRGAQPIIVGNDFRANAGAVVSINANSLADVERPDTGRNTGAIERFGGYDDNVGPLVRSNRMSYGTTGVATAGLAVRGEEITVESVWDDTDITHVLTSEIIVKNFHTATGLRLVSKPNESLVVKLFGDDAGFTASGYGLDIQDRIGGTVQIVGQPGYPVILTSLRDDSVGAGLDPLGNIVKDTNTDGTLTSAAANDWRSLKFMPYSNDRNVAIAIESEQAYTAGIGKNDTVFDAQPLGVLAANFATGTNSAESAQEKSGDANRRLGFEVHGFISADTPTDVDTYQFTGYAGSEVWIDLDKTSSALDAMVELLDASGNVLARSADSALEGGVVNAEVQMDLGVATDAVYTLEHLGAVAASLTGVIWDMSDPTDPIAIQTFTCDGAGVLTFRNVLNQPASPAVTGSYDAVTGEVTVTYTTAIPTAVQFQYRYAEGTLSPAALGSAQALGKNAWQGGDFYSLNPRDAGMRVVLPGPAGAASSYFIRVRSQPRYDATTTQDDYETALADPAKVSTGASSGRYELRVRLQQRDEKPGSTVRYADIRYPATGIDVQGLPRNSLLAGETGENSVDTNDAFGSAQYVGNLLQTDRNTISIAGRISSETDVDWYTFSLNYEQIQAIPGVNASGQTFATMFDIDYADGFRGDLTISVFDESGTLIYVGRDSNVADDQPGTGQGNDFDDLARGSVGKLDPFIGSVTLPAGIPTNAGNFTAGGQLVAATTAQKSQQQRYYVAISSNEQLPTQLDFTINSAATNAGVRLEPITSVRRIAEDHIGFTGYTSGGGGSVDPTMAKPLIDVLNLSAHATAFTLGDVTLFVSSKTSLSTFDAVTGKQETIILPGGIAGTTIGDLDMRRDGRLYAYAGVTSSTTTAGLLLELDPGTGAALSSNDDGIEDPNATTPLNFQTKSDDVTALAFKRTAVGTFGELWFTVTDGTSGSKLYRAAGGGSATTAADATADQTQATSTTLGFRGAIEVKAGDRPIVTGLQYVDEVGTTLLGVTRDGRFISIAPGTKTATTPADTDLTITAAATGLATFTTELTAIGATGFEALASAPLNLQNGRFAGTLFALTDNGRLCVIDSKTNKLVDVPEWGGSFSPSMGAGLTGIAFSPLDFNLWHPTTARSTDAGHGVQASADGTRKITESVTVMDGAGNSRKQTQGEGGVSMYFGIEDYVGSGVTPYLNYDASRAQYGLASNPIYQDLTESAAIGTAGSRFGNYNLPGGAFGSLTTNPFSLSGYQYADKPTLYFNYFLETQQASGKTNEMRDSARVLVSVDGGLTWELLATNNSSLSTPDTPDAELPAFASVSSKISTVSNQHVQRLFDGTGAWRQARIDLGNYAGSASVQLRFDFSTAGEFDAAQPWSTTRRLLAAATATDVISVDDVANLQAGDTIAGLGIPAKTTVLAVDPDTGEVTLSGSLTLAAGTVVSFTSPTRLLNDIAGKAGTTGFFKSPERGQKNDFEGFYVDDILVGFAERGEMVTGAAASQTGFFDIDTPKSKTVPEQTLFGAYQLEIRRGTDYVTEDTIQQVFDTNDGLVESGSRALGIGATQGDANLARQQGAFLIENNVVSHAGGYGIAVDAAARDGESNMPHPGVARNLPVLNANRLVPGVVIVNNVISMSGIGGLLFSGDATPGSVPPAVTPFGIIMNNTMYGGPAATGIGLEISDNAGPTVLNNVFASLNIGVSVDASSAANTVVATSAFHNTTTPVIGIVQTQGIMLSQSPFVSAARGNFYPAPGAAVIDSALNALQDRSTFVAVNSGVGIGPSPILAPDRDLFGQLRSDDPSQAGLPGLGGSVFKDRGAIDRVDFVQPYARLAIPLDDGSEDLAAGIPNAVTLSGDATSQTRFELQLDDLGIGIDKTTVVPEAFSLTRQGSLLVEGKDYVFRYLETSNRVVLESASVFRPGSYVLTVHSREESPSQTGLLIDYANNTLLPNNPDGTTTFSIVLVTTPGIPTGVTGTTASSAVNLVWTPPAFDGGAIITDYVVQFSSDSGATWTTYTDGTSASSTATVTGLTNGTGYLFRVAAVNSEGTGDFSQPSYVLTPGAIVTTPDAPSGPTGVAGDAQISLTWTAPASNGGAAITDYLIQFSSDSGASWTSFVDGTSASTSTTVTGLTNGVGYLLRVAAVNSAGTGTFSSITGTLTPQSPFAAPDAPTGLAGYRGNGQVIISWIAPASNGGATITDYVIQYRPAASSVWITFNDGVTVSTSSTVTGLTNGTGYVFRVAAKNVGGIGAFSNPTASITPSAIATVPAPPTTVAGTATDGAVLLSWVAPVTNGGATISDYAVQYSSNSGATWLNANDGLSAATTATVRGLTNGTNYVFRVAAVNSVGTGTFSARSAAVMPVVQVVVDVASNSVTSDSTTRVGAIQLVKRGSGSLVWAQPNSHVGGTVLEAGILKIQNASALGSGPLIVRAGATLVVDLQDTPVPVSSLTVDAGGRIDFGYGHMTIPYDASSWSSVRDLLMQGHAANWSVSTGLGSSKAATLPGGSLGYVLDDNGTVTFGFAAIGDTNLDGFVDVLDVSSMLAAEKFNTGGAATWSEGDFNYDGVVDVLDMTGFLNTQLMDAGRYLPSVSPQGAASGDSLSAVEVAFLAFGLDSTATGSGEKSKLRFASF